MPSLNMNVSVLSGRIASKMTLRTYKKKDSKTGKYKKKRYLGFLLNNRINNYQSQIIEIRAVNTCADKIIKYCRKGDFIQIEGKLKSIRNTYGYRNSYRLLFYGTKLEIDFEHLHRKRLIEQKAKEKNVTVEKIWENMYEDKIKKENANIEKQIVDFIKNIKEDVIEEEVIEDE